MATASELSSQEIDLYRATAVRRAFHAEAAVAGRYGRAWKTAKQAAKLLKQDFGATRVVVFGSILDQGRFTAWSDVDIAAWGISAVDTYRALGAVWDSAKDIDVNLVIAESCRQPLLAVIEAEGIGL